MKIYVVPAEASMKKEKARWNSAYHQNYWFFEFHSMYDQTQDSSGAVFSLLYG